MAIKITQIIPHPPENVWQIIGDPARVDWVPNVTSCHFDGAVRHFTMEGAGELSEQIYLLDHDARQIAYGVIKSSAELEHHHATIQIAPHAAGSELIWTVEVQPAAYEPFIEQSMHAALAQLNQVLAPQKTTP